MRTTLIRSAMSTAVGSQQQGVLRVGVIGLGIMGRTHIGAWNAAEADGLPCKVVAVADRNPASLTGEYTAAGNLDAQSKPQRLFDPAHVRTYTESADLLADAGVDVVSICTHTDTHVELASAALHAGKHVLLEKPVALAAADAQKVADAAAGSGKVCMVAMCMRFWPAWAWLKDKIDSGTYGRVTSAVFQRLASPPAWSKDFYHNTARSGGAAVDLHIHDTDFIRYCFGEPESVSATGTLHHLTTIYRYAQVPHVVAHGGWDYAQGFPFRMRYLVNFEAGTADFDITRTPPLLWHSGGKSETLDMGPHTGYDREVRHLIAHLRSGGPMHAGIADAVRTSQLLEREIAQLR